MDAFAGLEIEGVSKAFGKTQILSDVSFRAKESELYVLCGPPASGKSTLARIICGFESPDEGRVLVHGRDITEVAPGNREIGYVPQSFALFPHYSVGDNIAYPLRLQKAPAGKVAEQVAFICEMLNISQLLEKRVDQISGGQKQRVALARGLVKSCALYVLDDPLVGLDFKLREQLVLDLRSLQKELGAGFLYLTSDPLDPLLLADSVAVLDNGAVNEVDTPADAYLRPRTIAMANALGFPKMNVIRGTIDAVNGVVRSDLFTVPVKADAALADMGVNMAVRPEAVSLAPVSDAIEITADVKLAEDLGADSVVHVDTPAGLVTVCHPSDDYKARHSEKERLKLWIRPQDIKIYALDTGKLLNCLIGSTANE